ncbi:antiterminator [Salipaludibacillus keqinensis]|uniref:Glycerol uptake operon antiterminator regulatory protein n=1 Tax=Salipaludibacillus keqinensis TaxID=2045207 RepID=A0A323TF12_9BACI|nr:glycerol-3-phosphate responsive antiterminator [Salipaludibacillus keqinensis]PYZ92614.1 antiterminator [Salipaludibacillus keqinensis]
MKVKSKKSDQLVNMIESQVIAAISSPNQIDQAIKSQCNVAFLLTGDICNMHTHVNRLQQGGLSVFVHLDLIEGLKSDKKAVQFIGEVIKPEGIITTKPFLIKYAKSIGLITIQRLFLIDSTALEKGMQMVESSKPDAIEMLPGIIPKVVDRISRTMDMPIITGGLLETKEEVMESLEAGALATSIGSPCLWDIDL